MSLKRNDSKESGELSDSITSIEDGEIDLSMEEGQIIESHGTSNFLTVKRRLEALQNPQATSSNAHGDTNYQLESSNIPLTFNSSDKSSTSTGEPMFSVSVQKTQAHEKDKVFDDSQTIIVQELGEFMTFSVCHRPVSSSFGTSSIEAMEVNENVVMAEGELFTDTTAGPLESEVTQTVTSETDENLNATRFFNVTISNESQTETTIRPVIIENNSLILDSVNNSIERRLSILTTNNLDGDPIEEGAKLLNEINQNEVTGAQLFVGDVTREAEASSNEPVGEQQLPNEYSSSVEMEVDPNADTQLYSDPVLSNDQSTPSLPNTPVEDADQTIGTQDTQNLTLGFASQPPPSLFKEPKRISTMKFSRANIKPQTIHIFARHVQRISKEYYNIFCFCNTYFEYCLLYGNVICLKINDLNRKATYVLDDGSGIIKVHFEHHSTSFLESQKNINSLKSRAASIKKTDQQLGCALETRNNWLEAEQAKIEHVFEPNSKVLVYGRPFYSIFDNKYHIHAENMTLDDDGDYEKSFKEQLIEEYKKYL